MNDGCWCCGQECMFCGSVKGKPADEIFAGAQACESGYHWCSECKFAGCEWCCGCGDCREGEKGGWSPPDVQISHDGLREREYRTPEEGREIP